MGIVEMLKALFRSKSKAVVIVIEEYQIEIIDKEGFKKLHVRFSDASGKLYRFEMHPAYAHAFSDDVLRHAARAMAPVG